MGCSASVSKGNKTAPAIGKTQGEGEGNLFNANIEYVQEFFIGKINKKFITHKLIPPNEKYDIITVVLHTYYDENQGMEVFNGIELEWRNDESGEIYEYYVIADPYSSDQIRYEVDNLDYIEELIWNQKETESQYITHLGFVPKTGKLTEVGTKGKSATKILKNPGKKALHGLELVQSDKDQKYFVRIKAIWKALPEKKMFTFPGYGTSFFKDNTTVDMNLFEKQMIYPFKGPDHMFKEFEIAIDTKKKDQEYLGALALKFLSPQEKKRLEDSIQAVNAKTLIKELHDKKILHKQPLSSDLQKQIVDLCTHLINVELQKTSGNSSAVNMDEIADNMRFLNKVFVAIYNDEVEIWNQVKTNIKESLTKFNTFIFKQAIDQINADKDMQAIKDNPDFNHPAPDFKEIGQKACFQRTDKGKIQDEDALVKEYIKEAKQFIVEFHATMRSWFHDHYIGAPVKGASRIKSKVEEYMEHDKSLTVSNAVAKVWDFLRGTIVCYSGAELYETLQKFEEICDERLFTIVRKKNGFKDLKTEGYKSILINITIYDCQIGEIQLTLKPMKLFNEISHYIYELQREENLYNVIVNYLPMSQQFKSWLDPFLPKSKRLSLPERYLEWKGYYIRGGLRWPTQLKLCFMQNGTIFGDGRDSNPPAPFEITGTHEDYKQVTFEKIYQSGDPDIDSVNLTFTGSFLDAAVIEGQYSVDGESDEYMTFRIFIGDYNYPTLSPGIAGLAGTQYKKPIPEDPIKWKGCTYSVDEPKDIEFELSLLPNGDVTGTGEGWSYIEKKNVESTVIGKHQQYRTLSFIETIGELGPHGIEGRAVYYDGVFVNNYTVEGKYNMDGDMGNFQLKIADPELVADLEVKRKL